MSVACQHSKQATRGALWTELCQLGIFSSRLKRSVNPPLLQISVVAGFANQLKIRHMLLEEHNFIAHCSLPLRTSMGSRWDKINCCHIHQVGLVKDAWKIVFPSKQWSVKVRVHSRQWSDVQKSHHLCHLPPPRLCILCMEDLLSHLLIPRNESKPRLLWSTMEVLRALVE